MLLSAVSVLVVAQSSSEIPEGLTNNPVLPVPTPFNLEKDVDNFPETWATQLTAAQSQYPKHNQRHAIWSERNDGGNGAVDAFLGGHNGQVVKLTTGLSPMPS